MVDDSDNLALAMMRKRLLKVRTKECVIEIDGCADTSGKTVWGQVGTFASSKRPLLFGIAGRECRGGTQ